ncbi:response regulator transcription factor [Candidatus Poribacteria bacterium]|nr:response regulator transcription factor [Candidatus Poribacteria bacterium]
MEAKILIVEDERDIVDLIRYNLKQENFKVDVVRNGADVLPRAVENPPDLILLDLMLPEVDGLIVCRLLKNDPRTKKIPIVMLTAKSDEQDRVTGLELGADDYITKPFSPREVVLRINAVLRRLNAGNNDEDENKIETHGVVIDLNRHQVLTDDGAIDLTATEFKLITLFAKSPGRVFNRDILMDVIWDQEYYGIDRTIDTHVSRLRRKLGKLGKHIETVYGVGYRLKEEKIKQ